MEGVKKEKKDRHVLVFPDHENLGKKNLGKSLPDLFVPFKQTLAGEQMGITFWSILFQF